MMYSKYVCFVVCFCLSNYCFTQNVGIGTADPRAKLDVAGDLILKSADLTLIDGNTLNLDVNTNKYNHYKLIGPTGNFQIGGIAATEHDRIITLYNRSGHSLEVYNDDVNAVASNRIFTGTGGTFAVYPGGSVTLKYDTAINKWEITASHYNSLDNFGSGNWTLSGNDIYNANIGNVGIKTSTPMTSLQVDGNLSLVSDTILTPCSSMMLNGKILIDNSVKKRSVFHILKDNSCSINLAPDILGLAGGTDGQIVSLIIHMDNARVQHLKGLGMMPSPADSMAMIELFEPNSNGNINQPNQLTFNTGGTITLIYDGSRNRWKPVNYYGEVKPAATFGWVAGGTPNSIVNPNGGSNVGIGFFNPTEQLHVGGNIKTVTNVIVDGEVKPNGVSGSAGNVLTSNGNGTMSWLPQSGWPSSGSDIKNPNSGNVGIGEFPSPGLKLDVRGNGSFTSSPPFAGIDYNDAALSLYTSHFPSTVYRYLKLDGQRIQSAGAPNIVTQPTPKDIYLNPLGGNIGINTTTDITSPLSFPNVLGKKISFYSGGNNNEFGFGIQTGKLQIYTAGQDQIAFGWGSSNNFIQTMTFYPGSAQLGINCLPQTNYHLAVNGNIRAKEIVVETANWPDYVFSKEYVLPTLYSIEKYIKEHGHLPNIPSAKEIEDNGQALGDTQKKMMEKIEELTLYIIQLNKEIEKLKDAQTK